MCDKALAVRRMTEADLALALEWAAAEGWNPGLHDARSFYAADPQGFLLAELDGAPAGSVSAVRYGADFGFLGLYIVRPEFRGRGFGLKLWRAALDHLGDRIVGLDGVVAQQGNYRRSGFALAFRNIRQRGEGGGRRRPVSSISRQCRSTKLRATTRPLFRRRAMPFSPHGSGNRKPTPSASWTGKH